MLVAAGDSQMEHTRVASESSAAAAQLCIAAAARVSASPASGLGSVRCPARFRLA